MSDIAITLSVDLWQKICSGDKPFEVRKQVPACFNYNRDRVYVILKGYKDVVGYFKIDFFARNQDPHKIWENHADKIGVKQDWWWKWVGNSQYVQVWMISRVRHFDIYEPMETFLGLEYSPQSYVYVERPIEEPKGKFCDLLKITVHALP